VNDLLNKLTELGYHPVALSARLVVVVGGHFGPLVAFASSIRLAFLCNIEMIDIKRRFVRKIL